MFSSTKCMVSLKYPSCDFELSSKLFWIIRQIILNYHRIIWKMTKPIWFERTLSSWKSLPCLGVGPIGRNKVSFDVDCPLCQKAAIGTRGFETCYTQEKVSLARSCVKCQGQKGVWSWFERSCRNQLSELLYSQLWWSQRLLEHYRHWQIHKF